MHNELGSVPLRHVTILSLNNKPNIFLSTAIHPELIVNLNDGKNKLVAILIC